MAKPAITITYHSEHDIIHFYLPNSDTHAINHTNRVLFEKIIETFNRVHTDNCENTDLKPMLERLHINTQPTSGYLYSVVSFYLDRTQYTIKTRKLNLDAGTFLELSKFAVATALTNIYFDKNVDASGVVRTIGEVYNVCVAKSMRGKKISKNLLVSLSRQLFANTAKTDFIVTGKLPDGRTGRLPITHTVSQLWLVVYFNNPFWHQAISNYINAGFRYITNTNYLLQPGRGVINLDNVDPVTIGPWEDITYTTPASASGYKMPVICMYYNNKSNILPGYTLALRPPTDIPIILNESDTRKAINNVRKKLLTVYQMAEFNCVIPSRLLQKIHKQLITNKNIEFETSGQFYPQSINAKGQIVMGVPKYSILPGKYRISYSAVDNTGKLPIYANWHTHPQYLYFKSSYYMSTPSDGDYIAVLNAMANNKLVYHVVFTYEGCYLISLNSAFLEQVAKLGKDNADDYLKRCAIALEGLLTNISLNNNILFKLIGDNAELKHCLSTFKDNPIIMTKAEREKCFYMFSNMVEKDIQSYIDSIHQISPQYIIQIANNYSDKLPPGAADIIKGFVDISLTSAISPAEARALKDAIMTTNLFNMSFFHNSTYTTDLQSSIITRSGSIEGQPIPPTQATIDLVANAAKQFAEHESEISLTKIEHGYPSPFISGQIEILLKDHEIAANIAKIHAEDGKILKPKKDYHICCSELEIAQEKIKQLEAALENYLPDLDDDGDIVMP